MSQDPVVKHSPTGCPVVIIDVVEPSVLVGDSEVFGVVNVDLV